MVTSRKKKKKDIFIINKGPKIITEDDDYLIWNPEEKELKEMYFGALKQTRFKNDQLLHGLADYMFKRMSGKGLRWLKAELKKQKISIKEISLFEIKTRKDNGQELIDIRKKVIFYFPEGFSKRHQFNQVINLQHKYKLYLLQKNTKKFPRK